MITNNITMNEFKVSEIGLNAGRIWNELQKRTSDISIQELCHKLCMTFEESSLSIGWLAKEKKIVIRKIEGRLMLSKFNSDFSWG